MPSRTARHARPAPAPFQTPVLVTRPLLPPLADYAALLENTWSRHQVTNDGPLLLSLQDRLSRHLDVPNIRLLGSGTLALQIAIAALGLHGEVVTTAFTFPASPHALTAAGITPVFVDIHPVSLTLDPAAVERAITPATTAILGVHVYGIPCDVHALADIARRHGLRLLYDGAHAFDTRIHGAPIASFGDATMLSLHATKLFHTGEGGALIAPDPETIRKIDLLKNFGLSSGEVLLPGINAKMNELEAALGLLVLDHIAAERQAREQILAVYQRAFHGIPGLRLLAMPEGVTNSHQYAVLMVDPAAAALSRDALFEALQPFNVFARRYFNPLCSVAPHYRDLPSAAPANLHVSHEASAQVLCLPYYGALGTNGAEHLADIVLHLIGA